MNEEIEHLNDTLEKYDEVIEDSNLKLKNLKNIYKHDYDALLEEKNKLERRINNIEKAKLAPYFARIDFKTLLNTKEICYIGKVGVSDYDNNIITVDWRTPIASLYYDSNIGITSYKVNDDVINGELLLKRQYVIENSQLISYNDVDTVSNDELLKPYLGVNADSRLKNIVATIQSEQNEIIRSSIGKNIIVQGVAGSGKTTVALHRIAYLAYNYRDIIRNNQYMVIGPNKFFLNYISQVLPDLDVDDVKQHDLIEFVKNYLGENLKININESSNCKEKISLGYKQFIDDFFDEFKNNIIGKEDIKIKDFTLISNNIIKKNWEESTERNYDSLNLVVDRCILLLEKYLSENHNVIISKINNYFDNLVGTKSLNEIRKERTAVLNEFQKSHNGILKKYFSRVFKKTTDLYKEILKKKEFDNNFYYEDIGALIYVHYKINGSGNYTKIKHVVIDEAQDYNEFVFYSLMKVLSSSTFSIYGDLAQSLYPNRSLNNWEEIINIFSKTEIKYLSKSYRTSIEIMNEANKINKLLHLPEAEAVIRHGDNVEYISSKNKIKDIENILNIYINKGLGSIAIITKDDDELYYIYEYLKSFFDLNKIDNNNQKYVSGICVITSRLSKGLEFDGVIISDSSKYNKNDILDMKLLYVGMTRAIHNLCIIY